MWSGECDTGLRGFSNIKVGAAQCGISTHTFLLGVPVVGAQTHQDSLWWEPRV